MKNKKAFIETIILIIAFFVLITFCFRFFNQDKNKINEVPYVDNFFQTVGGVTGWLEENINDRINFGQFLKNSNPKKTDIEPIIILDPTDLEN